MAGGATGGRLPGLRLSEEGWIRLLLTLVSALALIPIWLPDYLPLQDLPNHLLKVDIAHRYLRGDSEVRAIYDLNLKPFPNYTFYFVTLALGKLFSLVTAAKIFVSGYLLALSACAYKWLRQVNPGSSALALSVPAMGFNLFLAKGTLNFCAALALYLAALAVFARPARTLWRQALAFALVASLLYLTHGIVFLTLVAVVGCVILLRPSRTNLVQALGLVPGLVGFAVILIPALLSPSGSQALAPTFTRPGPGWIAAFFGWLARPDGRMMLALLGTLWLILLAALFALTAVRFLASAVKSHALWRLARERQWLIVAFAVGLMYCLAPMNVRDWALLQMRFVPLVVLTALGAIRIPARRSVRIFLVAAFTVSSLSVLYRNTRDFLSASTEVEEYVSGLAAFEQGASLLPIYGDEPEWDWRLNLHTWSYYHLAKGGWGPYLHAFSLYHPVVYRTVPWHPPEEPDQVSPAVLRQAASCYDYLLLWNRPDIAPEELRPDFELVHQTRHLRLWRNRAGVRARPPSACDAMTLGRL